MPHLTTDDGVKLYYEETGKGIPIVFIHEFAGDCRSWEQQVRYFARYYRCAASEPRSARLEGIRRSARRAFDEGAALTMRGVQKRRPALYELVDKMKTITAA